MEPSSTSINLAPNLSSNQLASNQASKNTIQVCVNGTPQQCPPNLVMVDFLTAIGLNPKLLAVEHNGEILHRQFWTETVVQGGDHLEIVTIVGGG